MAEGITLTGQLSNIHLTNSMNEMMNRFMKTKSIDYVIYGDTDSVVGDSIIEVNGEKITIKDYYEKNNNFILKDTFNRNFVKIVRNDLTPTVELKTRNFEYKKIKYVMKHTVKKEMFKISVNGSSVTVTEDHSIIVKRNGRLFSVKPINILKTDKIINI